MLHTLAVLAVLASTPYTVSDQAGVLGDRTAAFQQRLEQISTQSNVHVGVLTVENLNGEPRTVARNFGRDSQLGPRGVVVFLSLNPGKVYIYPGRELAGIFNSSATQGLIRTYMVPAFREHRYADGLFEGVNAIANTVGVVTYVPPAPVVRPSPAPVQMAPVYVTAAPTVIHESHALRNFFLWALFLTGLFFLVRAIYRWATKREEEYVEPAPVRFTGVASSPSTGINTAPTNGVATQSSAPVSGGGGHTTVINNNTGGGGGSGFVTGLLVGDMLASRPAPAPVYAPAPTYTPPAGGGASFDDSTGGGASFDSSDDSSGGGSDFDSGSSGGGSSFSSSDDDDDSSSSSSGGGSSFSDIFSDSGGGSSFDSGSDSGGGGFDFGGSDSGGGGSDF